MITIADYIGFCNLKGDPIGHPVKVINETVDLLKSFSTVAIAASKKQIDIITEQKKNLPFTELEYSICAFSTNKIECFLHKWKNLDRIFSTTNGKVWFVSVDFCLFLYLFLHKKRRVRSIISLCYNPFLDLNVYRHRIVYDVLRNVHLIVATNANLLSVIPGNGLFVPDYYYSDSIYSAYQNEYKCDQIVCLGTMGETKKLEDLVKAFSREKNKLKIMGDFSQYKDRYTSLLAMKTDNINIIDKRVDNEEYYRTIAESKYVVLPYDMKLYDERTSGILLETIFLHSVPIAPKKLLEYNGINGLGYEDIFDIPKYLGNAELEKEIVKQNNRLVDSVFSVDSICEKIQMKL